MTTPVEALAAVAGLSAEEALRAATGEELLRTFAALTHRMDRIAESRRSAQEVRAQRDQVQTEILRRMERRGVR
jgi:hypothetical protein